MLADMGRETVYRSEGAQWPRVKLSVGYVEKYLNNSKKFSTNIDFRDEFLFSS